MKITVSKRLIWIYRIFIFIAISLALATGFLKGHTDGSKDVVKYFTTIPDSDLTAVLINCQLMDNDPKCLSEYIQQYK